MYKSIPCISRHPIFYGKKSNFLISLLNVTGTLILYSSISGNVDTQKNQGLKRLRRNPPEVRVKNGQNPSACTKIIYMYIVLQTSVRLF